MIETFLFLIQACTHYSLQTLTTIGLVGNQIGNEGAQYLANTLQQNKVAQLTSLVFSQPFTHYFLQILTTLNLSNNRIGAEGAQHLVNALQQNKVARSKPIKSMTV
jgi:Ran GTPase-activating protein (RanGAP) involved in mRNA processing and transport